MFRPYLGIELQMARAHADELRAHYRQSPARGRRTPPRRRTWVGWRLARAGVRALHEGR